MARQATDDWRNATIDYKTLISEGRLSGYKMVNKFASTDDITGGAATNILSNNMNIEHFISTPRAMRIQSTSTADSAAGANMQKVMLTYLDEDGAENTEIITLNGTTAVSTVATDIFRVVSMCGIKYGASSRNGIEGSAGTITLTHSTGTPTYSQISTSKTHSESVVHWVAPGKRVVFSEVKGCTTEEAPGVEIGIMVSQNFADAGGDDIVLVQACGITVSWGNPIVISIDPHFSLYNDSDYIQCVAFAVKASGTGPKRASGSFVLYEFEPDY